MPYRGVPNLGTFSVCAVVAMWGSVGIVCLMLHHTSPGSCVMPHWPWFSPARRSVMGRDISMPSEIDALIEAMNAELVMGHWHAVVVYASTLHAHALALGEVQLAALVRAIQVIAETAVRYPAGEAGRLEVAEM